MSDVLRYEVMQSAASQIKDFLDSLAYASRSTFKCIEPTPSFDRAAMSTNVLACMWSVMDSFSEASTVLILTDGELVSIYRRNGPESLTLNSSLVVGIPALADDPLATTYLYVPDAISGMPRLDGRFLKVCSVRQCPAVMDPAVYAAPIPPLKVHPVWVGGQALGHGQTLLKIAMASSGVWEPVVFMTVIFRDLATNALQAMMSITYNANRIKDFLLGFSVVDQMGGTMFITVGPMMHLLSATRGAVAILPAPGAIQATPLAATSSDDEIVRFASRYINVTYGSDMFVRNLGVRTHVPGHGEFYVSSQPLVHTGLTLVSFLVVPVESFRGDIDDSRATSLKWTAGIVALIFVAGVASILFSMFFMGRAMRTVTRQNEMLTEKLALSFSNSDWGNLDMGTTTEKLQSLVARLRPGQALTSEQVSALQGLLVDASPEDMHLPQFLRAMQQGRAAGDLLDRETGNWLTIMTAAGNPNLRRRTGSLSELLPPRSPSEGDDDNSTKSSRRSNRGNYIAELLSEMDPRSPKYDESITSQVAVLKATAARMSSHAATRAISARSSPTKVSATVVPSGTSTAAEGANALMRTHGTPAIPAPVAPQEAPAASANACLVMPVVSRSNEGARCDDVLAGVGEENDEEVMTPRSQGRATGSLRRLVVVSDEVVGVLGKLGSLELDTLQLARVTEGRPITYVGYVALDRAGLLSEFNVPRKKLVRFLTMLERGMKPDALYHSAAHIADVTGCLFHLLMESGMGQYLRRVDVLAALCASLVHDYKHPGVNNDFIQRMGGELAICYNDNSILENHHLAEAFRGLQDLKHNFLIHLGRAVFADVRHIIIEMVLATDLKRHFLLLDTFRSRLLSLPEKPWDIDNETDRLLLLRMALKVADLGHTCKALPLHRQWTDLIIEEFYLQGDAEREAKLDVSPFMDRSVNCVPKAQHGFFHFVVMPLVEAWVKAFPKSQPLLSNLISNSEFWKNEQKKVQSSTENRSSTDRRPSTELRASTDQGPCAEVV